MNSLQARILATLASVIFLSWTVSLSIMLAFLTHGHDNVWEKQLNGFGDRLIALLPPKMTQQFGVAVPAIPATPAEHATTLTAQPKAKQTLIAVVINTLQLAVLGTLLWWAVCASLRPLRSISLAIASRNGQQTAAVSTDRVPDEIRPLIESFNTLLGRVEQAMRTERHFIADAAHELRTPLSALHAYAEIALSCTTLEAKDATLRRLLEVARRSNRLAEQLLDLARLDAGLNSAAYQQVEMGTLIEHVLAEFSLQAQARGTTLDFSPSPCLLLCDIDAVGILIRNLVDNAISYGRTGGVVKLRCGYCLHEDQLHPFVEICDDGPGVPVEARKAIFERFYRTPTTNVQGSGIGLSLVAGIAKLHEATIETGEGTGGHGLSVRIVFPPIPTDNRVSQASMSTQQLAAPLPREAVPQRHKPSEPICQPSTRTKPGSAMVSNNT